MAVVKQFPAFYFHKGQEPRKFKDPDELAAAGDGWVDSPEKVNWTPEQHAEAAAAAQAGLCPHCGQRMPGAIAAPVAPAPVSAVAAAPAPVPAAVAPPAPAPAVAKTEDQLEAEAEVAQYGMTVPGLDAALQTISDVAMLTRIRAREQRNPKGARKGVIESVDRRIATLGGPAPVEPEPEPATS
jgi:hypothetical protein